jgi:hypothetical protein
VVIQLREKGWKGHVHWEKSKGTSLMQLHQRSLEVLLVRSVRWMYATSPRAYVKNWTPRGGGVIWWGTRWRRHNGWSEIMLNPILNLRIYINLLYIYKTYSIIYITPRNLGFTTWSELPHWVIWLILWALVGNYTKNHIFPPYLEVCLSRYPLSISSILQLRTPTRGQGTMVFTPPGWK